MTSLSLRLQEAGASPEEAKDYLDQLQRNLRQHHRDETPQGDNPPGVSMDHDEDAINLNQQMPSSGVNSVKNCRNHWGCWKFLY